MCFCEFFRSHWSQLLLSMFILVLFILSFRRYKNLRNKNDNRIELIKIKKNQLLDSNESIDKESINTIRDLLQNGKEEQIDTYKLSVELFKWFIAEVVGMIGLLAMIWKG